MESRTLLAKKDILKFLKQNQVFFREQFHIKKIGLFGSFIHDQQTEESDIDIIVELEENTPGIYELKQELRKFVCNRFNRDVDIAREKYLKSYVKQHILDEVVYVE